MSRLRRRYRYMMVDVFTKLPLKGAPLAVFYDAEGLDESTMLGIAYEMNPYATTFVLPAVSNASDRFLRIFGTAPLKEWRFAGHPTIGSALAMRRKGIVPSSKERIIIEEHIGPVQVRFELQGDLEFAWLTMPPVEFGPIFDTEEIGRPLGLTLDQFIPHVPVQIASAGQPHLFVPLRTPEAVDSASVDLITGERVPVPVPLRFFVFAPTPTGAYARMFAPQLGFIEDPATGSAMGPLAALMMRYGLVSSEAGSRWICEQGSKMGRRSEMHVRINGPGGTLGIEVGGTIAPVSEGFISLN